MIVSYSDSVNINFNLRFFSPSPFSQGSPPPIILNVLLIMINSYHCVYVGCLVAGLNKYNIM